MEQTLLATGKLYTFFDDGGALSLREAGSMIANGVVGADSLLTDYTYLTDMTVGTVTQTAPLAVKIREGMADIPQEALWLTAAVVEKKIPVLEHEHITKGFRHGHAIPSLSHSHSTEEGETGAALEGTLQTGTALDPDAYTSDKRLPKQDIICYEDGKPLPVRDGYIILNLA